MTHDRINEILIKGIQCPVCGLALIDLEHDGYEGGDSDYHEYYCTDCNITIQITNVKE